MAMTTTRTQRWRTLKNDLRRAANAFVKDGLRIGEILIEMQDDELWEEEYDSFDEYLKDEGAEIIGTSVTNCIRMMQSKRVQKKLGVSDATLHLKSNHYVELSKLAPTKTKGESAGREKDYNRLSKTTMVKVLKSAESIAEADPKANGKGVSVRHIRKAVNEELGIDPTAKAKETKQKQKEKEEAPNLHVFLQDALDSVEVATEAAAEIPGDAWELLEDSHPGLVKRLAAACDELAELLRS